MTMEAIAKMIAMLMTAVSRDRLSVLCVVSTNMNIILSLRAADSYGLLFRWNFAGKYVYLYVVFRIPVARLGHSGLVYEFGHGGRWTLCTAWWRFIS